MLLDCGRKAEERREPTRRQREHANCLVFQLFQLVWPTFALEYQNPGGVIGRGDTQQQSKYLYLCHWSVDRNYGWQNMIHMQFVLLVPLIYIFINLFTLLELKQCINIGWMLVGFPGYWMMSSKEIANLDNWRNCHVSTVYLAPSSLYEGHIEFYHHFIIVLSFSRVLPSVRLWEMANKVRVKIVVDVNKYRFTRKPWVLSALTSRYPAAIQSCANDRESTISEHSRCRWMIAASKTQTALCNYHSFS